MIAGVSRGGEGALLIGATYPRLVDAVVAYVPSANVSPSPSDPSAPSWTLKGKPVPLEEVAVERIAGPLFLVGGGDDQVWTSGLFVWGIKNRMKAHGRTDVTALVYARAGHALGAIVPNVPTRTRIETSSGTFVLGGSSAADAAGRKASWRKLLDFLAGP